MQLLRVQGHAWLSSRLSFFTIGFFYLCNSEVTRSQGFDLCATAIRETAKMALKHLAFMHVRVPKTQ